MVVDFSDIKRVVKGWIDRELDHKMILRQDDPLVAPLRELGEPMYLLESNPTVERIAKLIFDKGRELGVDIQAVRVWETPTSFASYTPADPRSLGERQLVGKIAEDARQDGPRRPRDRNRRADHDLLRPLRDSSRRECPATASAPARESSVPSGWSVAVYASTVSSITFTMSATR